MNYMSQILAFNDLLADKQLTSGQIALWYALMSINNSCGWSEWFTVANMRLELRSGLSRQGIGKCRNVLKQLGFIEFKSNGTGKASSYKIMKLYKERANTPSDSVHVSPTLSDSVQLSVQPSLRDSSQLGLQPSSQLSSTLNKPKSLNLKSETDIPVIVDACESGNKFAGGGFREAYNYFLDNIAPSLSSGGIEEMRIFCGELSSELVILAIDKTLEQPMDKWSWSYVSGILRSWKQSGIKNIEDVRQQDAKRRQNRQGKFSRGGTGDSGTQADSAPEMNPAADMERMKKILENMHKEEGSNG